MDLVTSIEAWITARVAHPILFALVIGLAFGTVIIPEVWRVIRQRLSNEDAHTTAIREQTAELRRQWDEGNSPVIWAQRDREEQQIKKGLDELHAEPAQQQRWLNLLYREYVVSHDNISPTLLAGTKQMPADWINKRFQELGKPWCVKNTDNGYQFYPTDGAP